MTTIEKAVIWGYQTRQTELEEEAYHIIGELIRERESMLKALRDVRDDLNLRAEDNTVAVGVSVWHQLNTTIDKVGKTQP